MGPDQIPNIFLKKTAINTAELPTCIFNQSISTHSLLKDWLQANINPLFKKGNTNLAVNYRPVSLTCVYCKLLEHIIYSHVMAHLQTNNLLSVHDSLQDWAENWGMRFNAQKCYILSTATARKETPYFYQLNGQILPSVPNTPYVGVTLSTDLKFNIHLNNVAKSYQCLAFVRRNLKYCQGKLRRLSYISLIRSKLEYSSSDWDPHLRKDIHQLEMVQRRAASFIKHDYSVSQMLNDLDLSSMENRRKMNKLTLLYKIRNKLLCIKENGYLERADSRTRDASRNYKLKSAKSQLYKHSFFINNPAI